ncbi:MAG: hypothetical protein L3J57_05745 [Desulfuromusa sp.]|nr:hypothetical protein [Desulfuromusa sp.]
MELTREIYWNVGHGLSTLLPMHLLTMAAIAVLIYPFMAQIKTYPHGQSLKRIDQLPQQIDSRFKSVLLQSKVLQIKGSGLESRTDDLIIHRGKLASTALQNALFNLSINTTKGEY